MLQAAPSNYHNEAVLLGFSDLKRLKSERPLVFERGKGIFIFDESGKDYIEAVSCFYCASLGFSASVQLARYFEAVAEIH